MLTFNAERHEYRFKDVVVPSVTQILAPLYDFSAIAPGVLEHARQRGVAVHRAVQLDINDDLDEASVAPEIAGYLKAWRDFRRANGVTAADFGEPEKPLYHPTLGFAGTPDIPMFVDGGWGVVDVKTAAALHPAWALQTAAYRELINANTFKGQHPVEDRYTLRLFDNGTFRLDAYTNRNDWSVFLAMLAVHRWRAANIKGD